jgi:hypothetical protein
VKRSYFKVGQPLDKKLYMETNDNKKNGVDPLEVFEIY